MTLKKTKLFNENLRLKLINEYKSHKDNLNQYCFQNLTDQEVSQLTNGKTLADKFVDDLLVEASYLTTFSDSYELIGNHIAKSKSHVAEIKTFINWIKDGEELFNNFSPEVKDSLSHKNQECYKKTKIYFEYISNHDEVIKQLLNTQEYFKRISSQKKYRKNILEKQAAEHYIEKAYHIFTHHHLVFTPTSPTGEVEQKYTLAVFVLKSILDAIPGFTYDPGVLSKKINQFKSKINKEQRELQQQVENNFKPN